MIDLPYCQPAREAGPLQANSGPGGAYQGGGQLIVIAGAGWKRAAATSPRLGHHDGGMSTNLNGIVTCSMPQYE
jgi:hypothetical protein